MGARTERDQAALLLKIDTSTRYWFICYVLILEIIIAPLQFSFSIIRSEKHYSSVFCKNISWRQTTHVVKCKYVLIETSLYTLIHNTIDPIPYSYIQRLKKIPVPNPEHLNRFSLFASIATHEFPKILSYASSTSLASSNSVTITI